MKTSKAISLVSSIILLVCSGCSGTTYRKLAWESPLPPRTQGIYLAAGLASKEELSKIFEVIEKSKINMLVVDVKDSSGRTWLGEAKKIPSVTLVPERRLIDMPALRQYADQHGIWLVARVVMFQDAVLIKSRPDWAIQEAKTTRRQGYKPYYSDIVSEVGPIGFLSPALRETWVYNAQIARAAVEAGFDEVQLDYVRFPDEDHDKLHIPGLGQAKLKPTDIISHGVAFLRAELPESAALSVDVFGRTVIAPDETIGQDVMKLAPFVDYLCPMLYPSLWPAGSLEVADPEKSPYLIIQASLKALAKQMNTVTADPRIRPWFQSGDWSPMANYGRKEIQAQLRAAADQGIYDWTLWQSSGNYLASEIVNFPR